MSGTVRATKLTFKGTSSGASGGKKEGNKKVPHELPPPPPPRSSPWVAVTSLDDLCGPLFIHTSTHCLAIDDHDAKQPIVDLFQGPTPERVQQVYVGHWLTSHGIFTLKSSSGKYLSCSSLGELKCIKEAIGTEEQWTPEWDKGEVYFKSAYGGYLWIKGEKLRADGGPTNRQPFSVQCQSRFKASGKQGKGSGEPSSPLEMEIEQTKRLLGVKQSRSAKLENEEELLSAQQQGRLHETLLERRVRSKSDKYC